MRIIKIYLHKFILKNDHSVTKIKNYRVIKDTKHYNLYIIIIFLLNFM